MKAMDDINDIEVLKQILLDIIAEIPPNLINLSKESINCITSSETVYLITSSWKYNKGFIFLILIFF